MSSYSERQEIRRWLLAVGAPQKTGRTSMHKLASVESMALAGKIANACAAMEGSCEFF